MSLVMEILALLLSKVGGRFTPVFDQLFRHREIGVRARADPSWMAACRRAGVRSVRSEGESIVGGAGDLEVRIDPVLQRVQAPVANRGADVIVSSNRSPGFSLRSASRKGRKDIRLDDTVTGDALFDRRFEVEGAPASVLALLDADTRRLITEQDRLGGLDIEGRTSLTYCPGFPTHLEIETAVRGALAIADRLSRPVDVRNALVDRATADPEPGVRREAIRALGRAYPDDPATRAAARQAAAHEDPHLRIAGAIVLGDEGSVVLEAMVAEAGLGDAVIARAVSALDQRLPVSRAIEVLADARDRRRHATARAAIQRLAQGPAEATLEPLVEVLKVDAELACDTARALGALGSEVAESALVSALGREVPGLRLEAAQALARVGSTASVIRLKEAAERYGSDEEFRLMARRAIAAIQSRAAGADRGQLSVADDQAGQLSLAQREAGRVSMAPGEPGRLSVPEDEAGGRPPVRATPGKQS
jgi:hypothetical protein